MDKIEDEKLRLQNEQVLADRTIVVGTNNLCENGKKHCQNSLNLQTNSYLTLSERTMENFQIDKSKWTSVLQSQVTERVIKVFVELTGEQARDYDSVKEAILNLFQLVPIN